MRALPPVLRAVLTAALASAALASPAAAASGPQDPDDFPYVARIDCGRGMVKVGSGDEIFAPLVNLATGARYRPVAWHLHVGKRTIVKRKAGTAHKRKLRCRYADPQAKGTVTILRPKAGRPKP
jgi:hypothetical protein